MKLICGLGLIATILVQATSAGAEFATLGPGSLSCSRFAAAYRDNPETMDNLFYAWAEGFMSGANIAKRGTYRDLAAMQVNDQKAYLRRYCDEHPLQDYLRAVMELYLALPLKKMPSPQR
jgi:hypothetical protein